MVGTKKPNATAAGVFLRVFCAINQRLTHNETPRWKVRNWPARPMTTRSIPTTKNEKAGAKKPTQQLQASFCGFFARLINVLTHDEALPLESKEPTPPDQRQHIAHRQPNP